MHGTTMKIHEYVSSGSRVVLYERTDGQTDMTKLIVSFPNFAKGPDIACVITKEEGTVPQSDFCGLGEVGWGGRGGGWQQHTF